MEKLIEVLIQKMQASPVLSTLLTGIALIAVIFKVFQYFQDTPSASTVLGNIWFKTISGVIAVGTAGVLLWTSVPPKEVRVKVFLDKDLSVSASDINELMNRFNESGVNVELVDMPVAINTPEKEITLSMTRMLIEQHAHVDLSTCDDSGRTAYLLVTATTLSGDFTNLLDVAACGYGAISTRGIGQGGSLADTAVRNYLSVSIPMVALTAASIAREKDILADRSPGVNRGCLLDFHRLRETYVQTTQQPSLCRQEKEGIERIFGKPTVLQLEKLFALVGRRNHARTI